MGNVYENQEGRNGPWIKMGVFLIYLTKVLLKKIDYIQLNARA